MAGSASLVVMPTNGPAIASNTKGRIPKWFSREHTALSFSVPSETGPGFYRNEMGGAVLRVAPLVSRSDWYCTDVRRMQ